MDLATIFLFSLFFLIGSTSWMLVNAIFVELPLFMSILPESYQLSYYLALSVQFGNVMIFVYLLTSVCRSPSSSPPGSDTSSSSIKKKTATYFKEQIAVPCIIGIGFVIDVLLAFLWSFTAGNFSVSLWILTGCAGAIGALSNLSFWSYASTFKPFCLIGLSTGMGCSSVVPAILAAIQEPGSRNRFSVLIYFLLIALWMLMGLVAFLLVNFMSWTLRYRRHLDTTPLDNSSSSSNTDIDQKSPSRPSSLFFGYLTILFSISCCNFFLPAVLPYFTLGDDARIFTWMLIAGMFGQPIGRCIHLVLQNWHPKPIIPWLLSLIQIGLFSLYFIFGRPLAIFPWILVALHFLFNFLFGFLCTLLFRNVSATSRTLSEARDLCKWLGCIEQLGACISAILAVFIGKYVLFAS